jgi:chorismate synthase
LLLKEFKIELFSHVVAVGPVAVPADFKPAAGEWAQANESELRCLHQPSEQLMKAAIDEAKQNGDTLGGVFEMVAEGLPVGLGDYTQWDRKLDGRIAQAMLSIQAMKGVEIGLGFAAARSFGAKVHDAIEYERPKKPSPTAGFTRSSNGAGGLEGGMTNGAPLVVRVAMKPISTLKNPLPSVNLKTGRPQPADYERSDVCAVPAASVVGENFLAFILTQALCEKFGGDSLAEMRANYDAYLERIQR